MSDVINFFPTLLLAVMLGLTLILLPLLDDEPSLYRDERQRSDER